MSQGIKHVITDVQLSWLKENFADTPNADICEFLDCGETTLRLLARSLGLEKSKAHLDWRQDKAREGLHKYYITHKPPGNFTRVRKYCFQKGNDPRTFKGFRDGLERGHKKRNQTIREEKARIAFGLPQRTKLQLKRQPRPKIYQRHYLKSLGYIIDNENNIAYYTPDTTRAVKMEAGEVKRNYFKFKPYQDGLEIH